MRKLWPLLDDYTGYYKFFIINYRKVKVLHSDDTIRIDFLPLCKWGDVHNISY
jgi:hypothetical protein